METGVKFKAKIANVTDNYINTNWRVAATEPVNYSQTSPHLGKRYDFSVSEEADKLPEGVAVLLYPNPTSDYLSFYLPGSAGEQFEVQIVDMNGRAVLQTVIAAGDQSLALQELNQGIYLIKFIRNGEIIETKKIIKR